jgi:hypothetical protein
MSNEPINPKLVAARIAAAQRLEDTRLAEDLKNEPRLLELLWFIQWFSFQPGGLVKLAEDVLSAAGDRVVTKAMKRAGPPGRDGQWTLEQALTAWKSEWRGPGLYQRDTLGLAEYDAEAPPAASRCEFLEWLACYVAMELTPERVNSGLGCDKASILHGLRRFNYSYFKSKAAETAAERLPGYLREICTIPDTSVAAGPDWFPDIIAVLLEFMASHAAAEKSKLAATEVSRAVFDAFEYSWESKRLVRITGDSRFGKTESAKTYCAMYPGRFRLVKVPAGDADSDLIREVAECLGMGLPFGRLPTGKRQQLEDILRHGRIGIALDECHYLFPASFTRNSSPSRLNWVRGRIVDCGLPCVLMATPQTYEVQETRFQRTTGYNLDQFTGRIALDKHLPEMISQGDLMAVARHHCGAVSQSVLDILVGAAMAAPNYVGAINNLASRALWISQRRGARAIALEDVRQAVSEVPGLSVQLGLEGSGARAGAIVERQARPSRQRRKTPAEVVRELRPGGAEEDFGGSRMPAGRSEVSLSTPVLEAV